MKKTLIAVTMVAALIATAFTAATSANAQGRGERQFFRALGVGAGVGIGLALFGAAARANIEPRYQSWAPQEGYYYYQGYSAVPVSDCPNGFWAARIRGYDPYGRPIYGQPRWTCPPYGATYQNYYYR
jgi:hypothetical protein